MLVKEKEKATRGKKRGEEKQKERKEKPPPHRFPSSPWSLHRASSSHGSQAPVLTCRPLMWEGIGMVSRFFFFFLCSSLSFGFRFFFFVPSPSSRTGAVSFELELSPIDVGRLRDAPRDEKRTLGLEDVLLLFHGEIETGVRASSQSPVVIGV